MKKFIAIVVVILVIVLGAVYVNSHNTPELSTSNVATSTLPTSSVDDASDGSNQYTNTAQHFSIRLPEGYKSDELYKYQASPNLIIPGVKFTIPASMATGTNLSSDTYISVEHLSASASSSTSQCTADRFFDGVLSSITKTENGVTYSVASSSDAGAGNRYDETVYALPNSGCMAVRYFIHYGAYGNYDPGTTKEFNEQAVLDQFDTIRRTLVVSK